MGNLIMTENNSEPGIPAKPVQPPTLNEAHDTDSVVSDHPAITRNVLPKSRRRLLSKKNADPLEPSKAAPSLRGARPGEGGPVRRRLAWYWVAGLAVLLLVAGMGIGATLPDPKNSKEYVAVTSEKEGLQSDLLKLQARYDILDAGIKGREAKVLAREGAVSTADAAVKTADAAVKKREEAVTAAEKTKAANTIKEGTWTVGVDLEPGTYRTNSDVASGCYWGIYRTGSNGSDIVDNDIVSGGRPSVTLSAGQDFKSSRCGTWSKQ
jgi:hypothetical protein